MSDLNDSQDDELTGHVMLRKDSIMTNDEHDGDLSEFKVVFRLKPNAFYTMTLTNHQMNSISRLRWQRDDHSQVYVNQEAYMANMEFLYRSHQIVRAWADHVHGFVTLDMKECYALEWRGPWLKNNDLCDGCGKNKQVIASDDGRGLFCGDCINAANAPESETTNSSAEDTETANSESDTEHQESLS